MRSKRLMSVCLVSAMAVVSVAGCSKSNARKIEGASDDACKFISVTEEILDMKAVKATYTIDIDATAKSADEDAEAQSAKGKITADVILDEAGNIGETFSVDLSVSGMNIKGELAKCCYIDNTVYVDMSGAYTIAENLLGQAILAKYTEAFGISADELKEILSVSISTGDLKASDFGIAKVKDIVQKLNDDLAKAYSDSKVLTVDKDTYTITLDKDSSKTFASSFATAFESNGSAIYDAVIALIEDNGLTDKLVSAANTISEDVAKGIETVTGAAPELNKDEVKTKIEDAIKSLKDKKDENLKKMIDSLKNSESVEVAEGVEVESQDVTAKMVITDEKDGYSFTMDMTGSASVSGQTTDTTIKMSGTVASTTEKVTAPASSKALSDEISSAYTIISTVMSLFMKGTGSAE